MTITVFGTPAPQGSKRFMGLKNGKGILVESCKRVKPWRESVLYAAREAGVRVTGPVTVSMTFIPYPSQRAPPRGGKRGRIGSRMLTSYAGALLTDW